MVQTRRVRSVFDAAEIPDLFTARQVSKIMYVSVKTVDNMRNDGRLESVPLPGGNGFRYPSDQAALAPFVDRLRRRLMAPA